MDARPGSRTLGGGRGGQLAAWFLLLLSPVSVLEAQQVGTVRGTVVDAANLQPLVAVQVSIAETGFTSRTNAQGAYVLENVPAGTVALRVERPR